MCHVFAVNGAGLAIYVSIAALCVVCVCSEWRWSRYLRVYNSSICRVFAVNGSGLAIYVSITALCVVCLQ